MSTDLISFTCSSCGAELKVPISFAGVTGPCPACKATITAPKPGESAQEAAPAAEVPAATPAPADVPEPERKEPAVSAAPAVEETAKAEASSPAPREEPAPVAETSRPEGSPAMRTEIPPRRGDLVQAGLPAASPEKPASPAGEQGEKGAKFPTSLNPVAARDPQPASPSPSRPAPPAEEPSPIDARKPSPVPSPLPTSVPQPEPVSGQSSYSIPQATAAAPGMTAGPTPVTPPVSPAPAPRAVAPPVEAPVSPPVAAPTPVAAPAAVATATTPAVASLPAAPPAPSGGLSTFAPGTGGTAPEAKKKKLPKVPWVRLVFPILFLILAGIVVYIVMDLNNLFSSAKVKQGPLHVASAPNQSARDQAKATKETGPSREEASLQVPRRLNPVSEAVVPVDKRDLYVEGEIPPAPRLSTPPAPVPAVDGSPGEKLTATEVLERFLAATTLAERRPYLSRSQHSEEELSASSLAGPLPEVVNSRSLHYMINYTERHSEHFYEVSFQQDPAERPTPILIQINEWGEGEFKIHTDAFLDLFEERLANFAAKPQEGPRTFHVVADAYKHCFDEYIPGWDRKSFLKMRDHPRMSPKLIAYFSRNSELADLISQPDALPWGESGICTVTVQWNTETADRPFVELVDVVGFTWEP